MALFWQIVDWVLLVFLVLLFARFVVDWVMVLARSWRPQGLVSHRDPTITLRSAGSAS